MEQSEIPSATKDVTELLHKQASLLGRAQVGLGHELDERRAAAVVVDERLGRGGDAALGAAHVDHLAASSSMWMRRMRMGTV